MDSSEDFVVVNEEKEGAETAALNRLHILIDLFSKSLDAVNQSNILLKDELRAALSVTLQHIPADHTTSTEEIIRTLDRNVASNEEVRANYMRRLCSRLVAVNDEKNTLLAENVELKEQLDSRAKLLSDQLGEMSTTIESMKAIMDRLEASSKPTTDDGDAHSSTSQTLEDGAADPSLSCLCADLTALRDRLAQLNASSKPSDPPVNVNPSCDGCTQTFKQEVAVASQTTPVSIPNVSRMSEPCSSYVQTDSAPLRIAPIHVKESYVAPTLPAPCYPCDVTPHQPSAPVEPEQATTSQPLFNALLTTNPFHEDDVASSTRRTEERRSMLDNTLIIANRLSSSLLPNVGARVQRLMQDLATNPLTSPIAAAQAREPRADQTPSFHACDEEPWCPCCSQRFASRADLEEHLPSCLE